MILALGAIAAGVALGFCVHLVNGSAISHFADAVTAVSGHFDLEVKARESSGFAESLYARVAQLKGVAIASPSVERSVAVEASQTTLHIVGVDVFTARQINPILEGAAFRLGGASNLFAPDAVIVNAALLDELHKSLGDHIVVVVDGQHVPLRIEGTFAGGDVHLAVMDIGNAQWQLHMLHRLSRIAVMHDSSTSVEQLRRVLAPALPPDAVLVSPGDDAQQTDRLSRAYRVNLDMLALMALFTGAFLVYSTQSLSVLRRGRQHALLRVIGVTQAGILRQVVAEGMVLGVIGSVAGLVLGALLAFFLLHALGGDLGGGYFSNQATGLVFEPAAALYFFAFGVGAALLGSVMPARRAAKSATASALKAQDEAFDPRRAPPIRLPLGLATAALVLFFTPAIDGVAVGAYLSMALLLLASIAIMPAVVRVCVNAASRLLPETSISAALALRRLWAAPTQGTVALSGIVASASLMVAMATMVFSFRASVDDWLHSLLSADVYLHVAGPGDSFQLDPSAQQALRAVAGVAHVDFLANESIVLEADRPAVSLLVRDYLGDRPRGLPIITSVPNLSNGSRGSSGTAPPLIWISEAMQQIFSWQPGDIEHLTLTRRDASSTTIEVRVAGIWRDYARQNGSIVIDAASYDAVTGRTDRSDAAFTLAPGTTVSEAKARIQAALPALLWPHLQLASPREIRATSLVIFDRSFAITYLLEVVAVGIGLAGVAATFSAQTIARAREFGMLRHLGVTRGEILLMLFGEGLGLALVGVATGLLVGLIEGQILIQRVNPQSFHWTMDTHVPWSLLSGVAAALIVASAGTAVLSGRGALSTSAVRAVRDDW